MIYCFSAPQKYVRLSAYRRKPVLRDSQAVTRNVSDTKIVIKIVFGFAMLKIIKCLI